MVNKNKKYYIEVLGRRFLFRAITRREYYDIVNSIEHKDDMYDRVCELAVLWPTDIDYDTIECGVPETVGNSILYVSGFSADVSVVTDMIRQEKELVERDSILQSEAIIMHVFPQYSLDDLHDISQRELFRLFAQAMFCIRFIQEEQTIINLNKTAEVQQMAMQRQHQNRSIARKRHIPNQGLGANVYGTSR